MECGHILYTYVSYGDSVISNHDSQHNDLNAYVQSLRFIGNKLVSLFCLSLVTCMLFLYFAYFRSLKAKRFGQVRAVM